MDTLWTDVMIDVETTGLNSHINGVIQLSAMTFNLDERKVGPYFDRCPSLLPFRQWDASTREFWMIKNKNVYADIVARTEEGTQVWLAFFAWLRQFQGIEGVGLRTWMKPTH